jgi:hypothetical protein
MDEPHINTRGQPMVGEMPADSVKQLQKLAQEAHRAADQMTDPLCKSVMLEIAAAYDRLAQHADAQKRNLKLAS